MKSLTFGSLFAGIGGFDLGFERAGMVCKWQVEIDPFCQKVLAKHWPDVERFEDVRKVGKHNLPPVDVICGGFPCQPHSYAGKREGSNDERDLWEEFARIVGEVKPKWVVAENVPGLLTSENGRYFGGVLRDLAQIGYDAEWRSIPAFPFGLPHLRKRIFIIANYRSARAGVIWNTKCPTVNRLDWQRFLLSTRERNDNGVPNRVDRLRSLGNAVVPQIAEFIGRLIVDAHSLDIPENVGNVAGETSET